MLDCKDLLYYDDYPQLDDISLDLYRDFSRSVLLKRRFCYTFDDDEMITLVFREYAIRHMLGIQHINHNLKKEDFLSEIDNGLSFSDFTAAPAIKARFKQYKSRIRMFACTYNTLRCGRVFYCPNQRVKNTTNVNMDYIIYREIASKGFNIGIRRENEMYLPLTILVSKAKDREKYIDRENIRIVKRLEIFDADSGSVVEDIRYTDKFITRPSRPKDPAHIQYIG